MEIEQEKAGNLLADQDQISPDELMHELESLDQNLLDEETKEQVTKLLAKLQQMPEEEKQEPEDEGIYEFNEKEQKPFSLSDLEQLEQLFIQHKIKNVFLENGNRLVVEYHNNNNNNNKAELQQVFNYLKSKNKTSLSQTELNQIITEQKKEQLPSTNSTNYLPYILGGAIVVAIGVFIYLVRRKKLK